VSLLFQRLLTTKRRDPSSFDLRLGFLPFLLDADLCILRSLTKTETLQGAKEELAAERLTS